MKIALVVALGLNNEIGANGKLLWHLPADLKRFKEITSGHHVLMGRKTYESIPEKFRPLPNRVNIILTTNKNFKAANCIVVHTIKEAIAIAKNARENELMIIGGGEIYTLAIPFATTLYITKVNSNFSEADTFFPKWNTEEFVETENIFFEKDEKNEFDFNYIKLEKKESH